MPLNVLIVEAHERMRQGLCCTDLGYAVDSVSSGEESIDEVREQNYGLVFMAGMNGVGIETTKKIREFNQDIPIYLVSATDFSSESAKRYLTELGLNGYIDKTIDVHKDIAAVLEKTEVDAYLAFCEKQGGLTAYRFKGEFAFTYLRVKGRIRPGQVVRVMYTSGGNDESYEVTEDGKLEAFPTGHSDIGGTFNPEDILSGEKAKDGWDIEEIFPECKF